MHLPNVLYHASLILDKKHLLCCFLDLYHLPMELFPFTQSSRCSPVFNHTADLCPKIKMGSSIGQTVFGNRTGRGELQCLNVSTSPCPACSSPTVIQHCHKGKEADITALAFLVSPGVRNSLFMLLF